MDDENSELDDLVGDEVIPKKNHLADDEVSADPDIVDNEDEDEAGLDDEDEEEEM